MALIQFNSIYLKSGFISETNPQIFYRKQSSIWYRSNEKPIEEYISRKICSDYAKHIGVPVKKCGIYASFDASFDDINIDSKPDSQYKYYILYLLSDNNKHNTPNKLPTFNNMQIYDMFLDNLVLTPPDLYIVKIDKTTYYFHDITISDYENIVLQLANNDTDVNINDTDGNVDNNDNKA